LDTLRELALSMMTGTSVHTGTHQSTLIEEPPMAQLGASGVPTFVRPTWERTSILVGAFPFLIDLSNLVEGTAFRGVFMRLLVCWTKGTVCTRHALGELPYGTQ